MSHIKLFQTVNEFNSAYTENYVEPWVSYVMESSGLSFNKDPWVTAITINNLACSKDIPATGGTLYASDCTYTVTTHYTDGSVQDVTDTAMVEGSITVDETYILTRHTAGTLTLIASMDGVSGSSNIIVYQEADIDYEMTPLTIEVISAGTIGIGFADYDWPDDSNGYYKLNDGEWINGGHTTLSINVNSGDKIQIKGEYFRPQSSYGAFLFDRNGGGVKYKIYGNILSLVYLDNFYGETGFDKDGQGVGLFSDCIGLVDAKNLIIHVNDEHSGENMYYGCNSLFNGCTNLIVAPRILPSDGLPDYAYSYMFCGCSSLTSAPVLPATTLTETCYKEMFYGCTSLTTAPELPATTLEEKCYKGMFYGCSNLNYIKCLATDISASNCTGDWVGGVSGGGGTFVKAASMNDWQLDSSDGIPYDWTVEDA